MGFPTLRPKVVGLLIMVVIITLACLPLALFSTGCEQNVVKATGIGATTVHPIRKKETPPDPLTTYLFGQRDGDKKR